MRSSKASLRSSTANRPPYRKKTGRRPGRDRLGNMQNLVSEKPYVPVPPHRGRIWPAILQWYVPRLLRKSYGVTNVDCLNVERLSDSLRAGHGVLLAPNHC